MTEEKQYQPRKVEPNEGQTEKSDKELSTDSTKETQSTRPPSGVTEPTIIDNQSHSTLSETTPEAENNQATNFDPSERTMEAASRESHSMSWSGLTEIAFSRIKPECFDGWIITTPLIVFGSLMTAIFLMFVAIEPTPRWLLLFGALISVIGTDGVIRQKWPRPFIHGQNTADSTPYLFLPALATITTPMLIEHNIRGYLVIPVTLLAGCAFTFMIAALISSVRVTAPVYPLARLISIAAVYLSAFALFSFSYVLDIDLAASVAVVGIVTVMLGIEVYREGQIEPIETIQFSVVTGLILGEARWAMHFIPIDGYLAGLALLLIFFLVTGLFHAHLTRQLNKIVAMEYSGLAGLGILLVLITSRVGFG